VSAKLLHSLDKAGAGDVGAVDVGEALGPCPSCGADLFDGSAENPRTGRVERFLTHPAPFCTYYGETDPATIERDIERVQKEN
jgi:hypothetical protein